MPPPIHPLRLPPLPMLALLLLLLTLPASTTAQSLSPSPSTEDQTCPPGSILVYSPFKPWYAFTYGPAIGNCWRGAICLLNAADEARKQQFGATAMVMGLLPIVLRDIAWPERRVVLVSRDLPVVAEVLVRALGLEPVPVSLAGGGNGHGQGDGHGEVEDERAARWLEWVRHGPITRGAVRSSSFASSLVGISALVLLVSYAALALIEVYSKRSALGCVYPIFCLTWCIIGFIPGGIHVFFRYQSHHHSSKRRPSSRNGEREKASAIQGADELWPVQFAWAVYYIIGTLVFTSIMAVTPLELFVWVVVLSVVTGASKMLALYICLVLGNPVKT
ncbi:uncharacterized protein BDV14DRAFT_120908 [Aspergillus stella-maris]|uniref:uncharacterized protein n=1 Tax=Aspergillus stella-maris TaxID=1810926 RepID=UPI003CCD13DC